MKVVDLFRLLREARVVVRWAVVPAIVRHANTTTRLANTTEDVVLCGGVRKPWRARKADAWKSFPEK